MATGVSWYSAEVRGVTVCEVVVCVRYAVVWLFHALGCATRCVLHPWMSAHACSATSPVGACRTCLPAWLIGVGVAVCPKGDAHASAKHTFLTCNSTMYSAGDTVSV